MPWFMHRSISEYDLFFKIMLFFSPFTPNLGILSEGKDGISSLWLGLFQAGVNGVYFLLLGVVFHFGLAKKSLVIAAIPVCVLFFAWITMAHFWGYI